MNRSVYLDHNASTPVHPEVVEAMLPYFSERFGNPSSVHGFGREAREGLETAREQVAHFLRVGKEEIVFTSGGTESDNMAIKGVAAARRRGPHHHVADRAPRGAARLPEPGDPGLRRHLSPVDDYGMVDPDDVRRAIRPDTILISLMHANSEVGHDPARSRARADRPRARHRPSRRRRADLRQGADRRRRLRHRSAVVLRPQDLRSEGGGGSLHPAKAPRWCRSSTAASTSGAAGRGPRTWRASSGLGQAVEIRARDMAEEAVRLTALRDRLWESVIGARVPRCG